MTKESVYEELQALVAEEAGVTVENLTLAKRGQYKYAVEEALAEFEGEYEALKRKVVENAYERAVGKDLLEA